MKVKSVPDRLIGIADLYRERNKYYGDNYKQHGKMLAAMFPNGLLLKSEQDFNRFAMFLQITHKVTRYGKSIEFSQGGHQDSLDDISNYSQMMAEYDDEQRQGSVKKVSTKKAGNRKGRRTGAGIRHRNNGVDRQQDSEAGKTAADH